MMVYVRNFIKLLMKYLKQTYISYTLKFPTRKDVEKHAAGSFILFVQKKETERT